jgi:ApaG protein
MKELFQHAAITEGIIVRVAVNFLPEQSRIEAGKWFWVYHIRIENESGQAIKLDTRHWKITDGRGKVDHVDGAGVVGEQPLLQPGQAHDYVSGCPLTTPTGRPLHLRPRGWLDAQCRDPLLPADCASHRELRPPAGNPPVLTALAGKGGLRLCIVRLRMSGVGV